METLNLAELAALMAHSFSATEFKSLCIDLNVDHEEVVGETIEGKCNELVQYMKRRNNLDSLVKHLREIRPQVKFENWETKPIGSPKADDIIPPVSISGTSPLAHAYALQAAFNALRQVLNVDISDGWSKYDIGGRANTIKSILNQAAVTTLTVYDRATIDNAVEYLRKRMSQDHVDGSESKPQNN